MKRHLLLFDIDGTLLLTGGAGMRSMERAGLEIFGPSLSWDGIDPSGGLDPVLLAHAARRSAIAVEAGHHEAFRARYVAILKDALVEGARAVRAMPGVHEAIAVLRGRDDVLLGVLTGNYAESAALKLLAVGIDPSWFAVSVHGDEAETRPALVGLALRKYEALTGEPADPRRVIVIGDTPRDVECALLNGCLSLGVATGRHPVHALRAAGAHVAIDDLSDPSPLLGLLDGREDGV